MNEKKKIGIHVSIAGGIQLSVSRASELGCDGAFQLFTCSPRRWNAKPITEDEAQEFREESQSRAYTAFVHMPYMPNLSSSDDKFLSQSTDVLVREIRRSHQLGITYLILHAGSFSPLGPEDGRKRLIRACRNALQATEDSNVQLLIENSASAKSSIGSRFESISEILKGISNPQRTGVCIDTCHAFAAGYDLSSKDGSRKIIEEFDAIIGIKKLALIHANDSKGDLNSGSDRHEHIGLGRIGIEGFRSLLKMDLLWNVPFILETPRDERRTDKENVLLLRKLAA